MINWKELEKFIAPGKVMTLVILIDGKEIGALSFNVDSLAYKAVLESIQSKPVESVKIADKAPEKKADTAQKSFDAKAEKALSKNDKTKKHPEFNPIPATAADNVDTETGEIKEEVNLPSNKPTVDPEVPEKRLTRADIMAQSESTEKVIPDNVKKHVAETNAEIRANEHSGSKSAEHVDENPHTEQASADQTFGEEW